MATNSLYGPETTEFRREFAVETDRLLRRRVILFIAIWGGLGLLANLPIWALKVAALAGYEPVWLSSVFDEWGTRDYAVFAGSQLTWLAGYVASLLVVVKGRLTRRQTLWISIALVILDGVEVVLIRAVDLPIPSGLWMFAISHLVASIVFPWSARQAMIPGGIVLAFSAAVRLFESEITTATWVGFGLSPLLVTPGVLICYLANSNRVRQFSYKFLQKRYGSIRQELQYAKMVHESLFPNPKSTGSVRFGYRYEPMRQIGGDFLHASSSPTDDGRDERLSIVLLDVTGHGIPAALTVNRLHGEIELLFADDPDIGPGEVLRRLNRYAHLTLAKHSIYLTALCVRIDPVRGTIEHASGGHPPAFLIGADGTIDDLGCTALVLGACPDRDFEPDPETRPFGVADALIAYTDGAIEARDENGTMVRIDGLRALLATEASRMPHGVRAEKILDAVKAHRAGAAPEDDTLVVEIYRPLGGSMPTGGAGSEGESSKPIGARTSRDTVEVS